MDLANHTNMELLPDGDMVQTVKENFKFKMETDQPNKRFESNENNEMKDCEKNKNYFEQVKETLVDDKDNENETEKKFMLIKDFYLFSRFTKLFPHLFINGALDWTKSRPRMLSEKEAINKML